MRKILFFAAVISLAACNSNTKSDEKMGSMGGSETDSAAANTMSQENISYPYTASYSSNFQMGDPKNSLTILNLWKAWDNGDLSGTKDMFADSIEMHFRNGAMMKGSRDSMMAMAQAERNNYSKVESRVDAFMPLKSVDKNENWVTVWGTEVSTDKKGKTDSVNLQETWRLNNNGKVDLLYQYSAPATPPPGMKN